MAHAEISTIRPPAVDGAFYPGEANALHRALDHLLASDARDAASDRPIRALIVPHAGWVYSGALAGRAYARLAAQARRFRRVLLLGPCHRVWVPIMALPATDAFETPLGRIPLDSAWRDELGGRVGMELCDEAHAQEHALEVQLPFLQRLLGDFELLPVVVGGAPTDVVAALVEEALADPETLVVVSTDLSHFHAEGSARRRDADTAAVVEALGEGLTGEEACGAAPLNGLLRAARHLGLTIERVGLATSADAGGPPSRVVGYGAWILRAPASARHESAP
ncbi:MAG: AmmeMemoRadiSam system protein B [Pseudomonadales bacterium]|jgi:AmmeMemoRadiSam system protein B|nr:AmmeMemoRadiSam system protein B [Pseudomonadales bacterium]